MATVECFEDLRIWQQARELNKLAYQATTGLKDLSFVSQFRRASLSVMNNIAEGFERRTDADFAHFLDVAKGSAGEARSMTYAAEDLHFIPQEQVNDLRSRAKELGSGIGSFANYLRQKSSCPR